MKKAKRLFAISMAALMAAASLAACGNSSSETQAPASDSTGGDAASDSTAESGLPTIDQLTLGEDYTDLSADLVVLTHRTILWIQNLPDMLKNSRNCIRTLILSIRL